MKTNLNNNNVVYLHMYPLIETGSNMQVKWYILHFCHIYTSRDILEPKLDTLNYGIIWNK